MTVPTTSHLSTEREPAASAPLMTKDILVGVAIFAGIWLVNGLVAIVAISLLQGAGLWETASEVGSMADDVLGEGMTRLGLAFSEARA